MSNEDEEKWPAQFALINSLISASIPAGRKGKFSAVAAERFLGVTAKKWNAWAKGQRPSAGDLERIGRKLGLASEWLLYGEGEPFVEARAVSSSPDAPPAQKAEESCRPCPESPWRAASSGGGATDIPADAPLTLTGLAECGIQGWYRQARLRAPVVAPRVGMGWIAVMAVGNSMIPAGIREGHILYCDPAQPPVEGEPVYVLRADGAASIKLWRGMTDNDFAVLQGWLPPDDEGNQNPYLDQLAPGQILKLAPVIYVRLRI